MTQDLKFGNVITARQETLEGGALVYSHPSLREPGQIAVRVIDQGVDICVTAPSRGEALEQLADHFRELGRQIRLAAWAPDVNRET